MRKSDAKRCCYTCQSGGYRSLSLIHNMYSTGPKHTLQIQLICVAFAILADTTVLELPMERPLSPVNLNITRCLPTIITSNCRTTPDEQFTMRFHMTRLPVCCNMLYKHLIHFNQNTLVIYAFLYLPSNIYRVFIVFYINKLLSSDQLK